MRRSRLGNLAAMSTQMQPVGHLLREWRHRRRLSQLDLALEAEISQRHLSFLESGRSTPSREMLLRLAEQLDVPLRERNILLAAAGFAPTYRERPLDDPDLVAAREAVDLVIRGHEPYPALAVDRHWHLVSANAAVMRLLAGVPERMLEPPVNVLRLSLHPDGLARRILNFREWREHVVVRLSRQIDVSGDGTLLAILEELKGYPVPDRFKPPQRRGYVGGAVVPFQLALEGATLSFFTTTTVFGTPVDVTLSELAIESFFPADAETAEAMQRMAAQSR